MQLSLAMTWVAGTACAICAKYRAVCSPQDMVVIRLPPSVATITNVTTDFWMTQLPASEVSLTTHRNPASSVGADVSLTDDTTLMNAGLDASSSTETRFSGVAKPHDGLSRSSIAPAAGVSPSVDINPFVVDGDSDPILNRSHQRFDPISGRWTIFASTRGHRPSDMVTRPPEENPAFVCPFCAGNEEKTPPAVLQWTQADMETMAELINAEHQQPISSASLTQKLGTATSDASPWAVRVVPNKYPAVDPVQAMEGGHTKPANPLRDRTRDRLFVGKPLTGGHEVFVESAQHGESLISIDLSQATMLFFAFQERMRFWRRQPTIQYISLFKNCGPAAGASLSHSHCQLIATDQMPMSARAMAERMKLYGAKTGCCLHCDTVREELKQKERIVAVTKSLVAYCPFGSHLPMLMRITTKRHVGCFEDLTTCETVELVRLVRGAVRWLKAMFPNVAYNFLIHTRPPACGEDDMSHWSLEIFPRITQVAGFEWSCDEMINPTLPEIAASRFRKAGRSENPLRQ